MDGYKQYINLQIVSTNHVKCWIKLRQCMSFLNALIYDYAISFCTYYKYDEDHFVSRNDSE